MILIPIGLIFVLFYINIPIQSFTVDILPDALGYILIAVNASKLETHSYSFSNAKKLCIFLAVYSIIVRLVQPNGMIGVLLSLTEILVQLYLLTILVRGIKEIEWVVDTHLNHTVLEFWRKWFSISWLACYVFSLLMVIFPMLSVLGSVLVLIWAVLGILFIVVLFRTDHRYRLLTKKNLNR